MHTYIYYSVAILAQGFGPKDFLTYTLVQLCILCGYSSGGDLKAFSKPSAIIAVFKEPAWHRRARQLRSQARRRLRAEQDRVLLEQHHGSAPPTMYYVYDENGEWASVTGRGNKKSKGKGKSFPSGGGGGKGKGTTPFQFVHSQPQQQQFFQQPPQQLQQQQQQPLRPPQHQHPPLIPGLQQQQQPQGQQHQQQSQLWWWCQFCNTAHPPFHQFCSTCEWAAAQAKGKAKGKGKGKSKGGKLPKQQQYPERRGRWRSGIGKPSHWMNVDEDDNGNVQEGGDCQFGDDDDDDDNKFTISTPPPEVDDEQINLVFSWIKAKGASEEILGTLNSLKAASQEPKCNPTKDPWRALQSCRDKLHSLANQQESANASVDKHRGFYDEALEWKEELDNKYENLVDEIEQLQNEVAPVLPLKSKVMMYEDLIRQLQENLKEGLPEVQSEKRKQVYNLVFKGKANDGDVGGFPASDQDSKDNGDSRKMIKNASIKEVKVLVQLRAKKNRPLPTLQLAALAPQVLGKACQWMRTRATIANRAPRVPGRSRDSLQGKQRLRLPHQGLVLPR